MCTRGHLSVFERRTFTLQYCHSHVHSQHWSLIITRYPTPIVLTSIFCASLKMKPLHWKWPRFFKVTLISIQKHGREEELYGTWRRNIIPTKYLSTPITAKIYYCEIFYQVPTAKSKNFAFLTPSKFLPLKYCNQCFPRSIFHISLIMISV